MSNVTKRGLSALTMTATILSLSGFAVLAPLGALAAAPADYGLKEGNTISAAGSSDPDIYIVNEQGYKRLFLNPVIFGFYGHLGGFAAVKNVTSTTRDAFPTSGLFRNCETNDPKVYGVESTGEDTGMLHWVNTSGAQAVADDSNFFKKVFCINNNEFNWYAKGADYTSVLQVPNYVRAPSPSGSPAPAPVFGNVNVSALANPGGSLIAGAAQVPVLNFRVMNSTNGDVWVTGAKFHKTGVVSDSNIANAYLSLGSRIVAQYTGLSQGVLSFTGNLLKVVAGESADVSLRVDISTGATNGNTVGFSLMSSADLTLSGGTLNGGFPITGGNYTITSVSNPSLATISSPAYLSVASTVDAGTLSFRGSALSLTVLNSAVRLQSVRYTVSGSTNMGDLRNLVLKLDGVQVGTAAGVSDGGYAFFDMSANSPLMNTGSHNLEVYVDVLGTANRNFKFEILRPFDWVLSDTQYNTNISGGTPSGTATTVSVRPGTATATLDASTPTGNIARGASNVTVAKFAIRAAGEGVKIKWLPFKLTESGSVVAWSPVAEVDNDVRNLSIRVDDGSQIGTTINTLSSCTYGTAEVTATTYICSIGSPSSNINFIIAANTTRIFSINLDVQSTGDITTLKGSLIPPSGTTGFTGSNLEGQISFQTSSVPGGVLDGSVLTISSAPFVGAQNSSLGSQTYVGGANGAKLNSYSLSASSAEGIQLTSVTLTSFGLQGNLNTQNLKVKVNGTEWNYTVPTVTASTSYTYSSPGGPTLIAAGGSVVVDVFGDLLTSSVASGPHVATQLVGAVGVGAVTNTNQTLKNSAGTAISTGVPVNGQGVTVAAVGTVTVSVDSTPPAQQIVLGSTDKSLARLKLLAGNNEDIKINDLKVVASTSLGGPSTFNNLKLYDASGALVGSGTALAASTSGLFTSDFHFPTPLNIPKNQEPVYTLKGDVASFTDSTTSHNKNYTFKVTDPRHVNAFGLASNQSATVSGAFPIAANAQKTLRTKLTATLTPNGALSGRARGASDDIALLTLNVDPAYSALLASVSFTLTGAALPPSVPAPLQLVDSDTNLQVASATFSAAGTVLLKLGVCGASQISSNPTGCPNAATPFSIAANSTKVFKVRVNSANFANGVSTGDSLSLQLLNGAGTATGGSLEWFETSGAETENIGLESRLLPLTSNVSYE